MTMPQSDRVKAALAQSRALVMANAIAERYVARVVEEAQRQVGTTKAPNPTAVAHMRGGMQNALRIIDQMTPVDFDALESMPVDDMCVSLNEALEHLMENGKFTQGYRPTWVTCHD